MMRILFICHGNICRSPMAEYVMKDLVMQSGMDSLFEIESAATSNEEIGNDVYPPVRSLLKSKGIPCPKRRARRIRHEDAATYDCLIGMDERNLRNMQAFFGDEADGKMFKLMAFTGTDADVADPWYTRDFESCYADIVAGCKALLHIAAADAQEQSPRARNAGMTAADYMRRVDEEMAAGRFASQSK